MATITKTDKLKNATCSPKDGVDVRSTNILRGMPMASTPAWNDTNVTKQHVANDSANHEDPGAMNDLKC